MGGWVVGGWLVSWLDVLNIISCSRGCSWSIVLCNCGSVFICVRLHIPSLIKNSHCMCEQPDGTSSIIALNLWHNHPCIVFHRFVVACSAWKSCPETDSKKLVQMIFHAFHDMLQLMNTAHL